MLHLRIPDQWLVDRESNVNWAVERIALIVTGQPAVELESHRWSLDESGNNWWASFDAHTNEIRVNYRYEHGQDEKMDALLTVIKWRLGLE